MPLILILITKYIIYLLTKSLSGRYDFLRHIPLLLHRRSDEDFIFSFRVLEFYLVFKSLRFLCIRILVLPIGITKSLTLQWLYSFPRTDELLLLLQLTIEASLLYTTHVLVLEHKLIDLPLPVLYFPLLLLNEFA